MTQTLAPGDTGEIRIPGETTQNLTAYTDVTAISRRPDCDLVTRMVAPDVTGEIPLWPTGAELAVTERIVASQSSPLPPIQPVPPPPPKPSVGAHRSVTVYVRIRPDGYRGRRRQPAPAWSRWAVGVGAALAVQAFVALSILAAYR